MPPVSKLVDAGCVPCRSSAYNWGNVPIVFNRAGTRWSGCPNAMKLVLLQLIYSAHTGICVQALAYHRYNIPWSTVRKATSNLERRNCSNRWTASPPNRGAVPLRLKRGREPRNGHRPVVRRVEIVVDIAADRVEVHTGRHARLSTRRWWT